MAAKLHNYSSIADIQSFWLTDIAPQYFDFDDTNLYKAGIFGYTNEVMSTVTADAFNAINLAKREFYSSTAENISTFYKLAGIFDVEIPMATPAECGAVIFIKERDIIENGTIVDGTYHFVLDNTVQILADEIQFSLDYPINIYAKYSNGAYMYTTYYDTSKVNCLSKHEGKYIQNKALSIEGERYLLLSVTMKQYCVVSKTDTIKQNSDIETAYVNFDFDGDIAGFDVFYTAEPGIGKSIHVPAYDINAISPEGGYCIYEFLSSNKIRLTFPKNPYFSPRLNSEITCKIYISKGKDGNFDEFNGDLSFQMQSEDYPYNNGIIIKGVVNGKSSKGKDKKSNEDFIREIRKKNCTNGTITTAADLEIYFNSIIDDNNLRVKCSKKRDDTFKRMYSTFILLKDDNDNIIPTNTATLKLKVEDFDEYDGKRGVIKPGKIFRYSTIDEGIIEIDNDTKLSDNLDIFDRGANKDFLFTNPFLILASTEYQIVGYYGNSISEVLNVDYTYVEDKSFYQFICLGLEVKRNPIIGETFYSFTSKISASTSIDKEVIIEIPDYTDEANNIIRAKYNGRVVSTTYNSDHVVCTIKYVDNPENIDTEEIIVSSYTEMDPVTKEFIYHTGFTMQFNVLDTFVQGDILAKKKVTDKGKIRAALDIGGILAGAMTYIPMYIEEYDEEKDAYIIRGYVSTNDVISLNNTMVLDHGIHNADGSLNDYVNIPMSSLTCRVSIFYKNDVINYEHSYSNFEYYRGYTMTNQYTTNTNTPIALIKGLDFIRSTFSLLDSRAATDPSIPTGGTTGDPTNTDPGTDPSAGGTGADPSMDPSAGGAGDPGATGDPSTPSGSDPGTTGSDPTGGDPSTDPNTSGGSTGSDPNAGTTQPAFGLLPNQRIKITQMPLVKSNWIKYTSNFNYYIHKVYTIYEALWDTYFKLENQFGIEMLFFNTYGKSKRYMIGNVTEMQPLTSVNCSLSVGIELDSMATRSIFIDKYRTYLKTAIENLNELSNDGKSLFLLDLLGESKKSFPEIIHFEYYGFNDYGYGAQIITPVAAPETSAEVQDYVPEFINIYTTYQDGVEQPSISIRILNNTALV